MAGFLQKGTQIANPSDIIVVDVAITVGPTSFVTTADPRLIGGRVLSTEIYPMTDIAKVSVIPTISATGVVTLTMGAASTAIATGKVAIALKTGNNV